MHSLPSLRPAPLAALATLLLIAALGAAPATAASTPPIAASAPAATLPYDEQADGAADLQRALDSAARLKRPLLVIFGANWCGDCRALDKAMHTPANAELIGREFITVKVDVGNFNRHLDLAARYGNPIRQGIPAAVVLNPQGELVYATRGGELASARKMSEAGVYEFFHRAAMRAREPR